MVLSAPAVESPARLAVPAGFELRTYQPRDREPLVELMSRCGFRGWGSVDLDEWLPRALPGGYFLLADAGNGRLAATTMAAHHPSALHPFGGELAWLAVDPPYRGRGLGRVISSATTRRLIEAGYRRIYLTTDDYRRAAIRIYLTLGYEPLVLDDRMKVRWQRVYEQLGWNQSLPARCSTTR